jgi:hypothetical protein
MGSEERTHHDFLDGASHRLRLQAARQLQRSMSS